MHIYLPNKYYFINKFETIHLDKQKKGVGIIFRNYNSNNHLNTILKLKKYCKNKGYKFYLSNNIKLAIKLDLDGVYIPSFNKDFKHLNYKIKPNFLIIGSAHNLKEIRIKETQNVSKIFISSIFKLEKNYLGFYKFKNLSKITRKKVIALGGINKNNFKKIKLLNIDGFAGIGYFEG